MVKPSATLPNLTGTVVDDGCLELLKILGAGAFGKLYKARDTASPSSSPTIFAVKCLREPTSPHEAHLQAKEYALHHRVSRHPNVVTLRRRFVDAEYLFIVMDLCVGGDMHRAITKGVYCGQTALIKRTLMGLIDGVRFCHSRGVFHRDLKPANVLVDADGERPRIADFGLSTASNSSLVPCGSPGYMSPESFGPISTPYSPALSDTWALAVVLVNLVVARNPWNAAVERDVHWNSFMADEDFLREIFPISRPLNALLQRCFSTNTALRPTLCELRAEVLAMPDFFMSHADLEKASPDVRRVAGLSPAVSEYDPSDCSLASSDDSSTGTSLDPLAALDALDAQMHRLLHLPAPAGLASPTPARAPVVLLTVPVSAPAPVSSARKAPFTAPSSAVPSDGPLTPQAHVLQLPPASQSSDQNQQPAPVKGKLKRFLRRLRVWKKM